MTKNDNQGGPRIAKNARKTDFGKPENSQNGEKMKFFEGSIF